MNLILHSGAGRCEQMYFFQWVQIIHLPPPPPRLLDLVFCSCKMGYITTTCKCRKAGRVCTAMCDTCLYGIPVWDIARWRVRLTHIYMHCIFRYAISAADSWNYRLLKRCYCSNIAVFGFQENSSGRIHTRSVICYFIPLVLYQRALEC